MNLQLDSTTLALMFITLAMTSFIVMLLIWRINRDMPGVLFWMIATLLNTSSALTSLITARSGNMDGWTIILGVTMSLTANMLVLEGALRFRGFESVRRWQVFLTLIPLFAIVSWITRADPAARSALHDVLTATFQISAGMTLIWRTNGQRERQANLLAASASMLIGLLIGWRLLLTLTGSALGQGGAASPATQWYLFAGANLHVAWIFGLSVACYFRSRQQVMSLAREDALTALPNRRWIDEKLSEILTESQRSGEKFALIMLDINNFKMVNDQHGHSAGDRVLTELARRLRSAVRDSDFAGRLGGDEFIVLARWIDTDAVLSQLVERLRQDLNGNMPLDNTCVDIEVSIGTAVLPLDGATADALLRCADTSMYRDKLAQKQLTDRK